MRRAVVALAIPLRVAVPEWRTRCAAFIVHVLRAADPRSTYRRDLIVLVTHEPMPASWALQPSGTINDGSAVSKLRS